MTNLISSALVVSGLILVGSTAWSAPAASEVPTAAAPGTIAAPVKSREPVVRQAQTAVILQEQAPREDWKDPVDDVDGHFGVLSGIGILDSSAGFTLLGTVSKRILQQGFVPDINNSVSIEFQGGPLFVESSRSFAYSVHLRWDFRKDNAWTFYSLGGVAGNATSEALGSRFLLFPRFAVGAMRDLNLGFAVRGELSHEFMVIGAVWPF